jgi:hypothetical protein
LLHFRIHPAIMAQPDLPPQLETETILPQTRMKFFTRVAKYILVRFLTLSLMLVIGMYIAVVVLNFGGFIDKIHEANIAEAVNFVAYSMPGASLEEIKAASDQLSAQIPPALRPLDIRGADPELGGYAYSVSLARRAICCPDDHPWLLAIYPSFVQCIQPAVLFCQPVPGIVPFPQA